MIVGIDLGTTYSLVGHGDDMYSGLVSSSVDVSTGKQCDRDLYGENIISSYKVNMTTGPEGELPIQCSSVILKTLTDRASMVTGQECKDVVISVPAKFSHTQREAVVRAAESAGLNMKGLINEPTAAAIYVCRDMKDLIVVYDLGGGTFDVTVIDSRAGNYYVLASDGRILAGDDFDKAIMEDIFEEKKPKFRYRVASNRKKLLHFIRIAKESLQKTFSTQYIDLSDFGINGCYELTPAKYINIMQAVFAETITLTLRIINMSLGNLEKPKMVFVGGSTACPYLREWVLSQTRLECIPCNDQPDYIVAKGVALYASMIEDGSAEREVEDVTRRLSIEDKTGQSITIIEKNTTIPVEQALSVQNEIESDKLEINLYQGDSILCMDNTYIGTLIYQYDEVKKPGEGIVEISVIVDRNGRVNLSGCDILTGTVQSVELVMR